MDRAVVSFAPDHFLLQGAAVNYQLLIADDHPLYRDALATTLSSHFPNADLLQSEDLDSTLERLSQSEVDLLLLDLNMPGSEGFSGLARIRNDFPAVPVVVVSGSDKHSVIQQASGLGASGFLSKTARPDEILQCIECVLSGDQWFSEEALQAETESALADKLTQLTPQQLKIFQMIAQGMLNKQIAYDLDITEPTVKSHVTAILRKLELRDRKQLIREAQALIQL
ncbi:response regulator [Microbulbifer agarilyticus]|uniref:response regulator n=1 Tax=Microbulbifer agarilyticus TaxID=260552 RepID=UPI001C940A47|nr:response regulator transcription factor [Microbulbifer agarilyticus]MBY6191155.1 response regulator transcription factor [Microbulbifer agarilyticus]MCA0893219.1 response regulator transcription factor [Microbulbifer agarilyticus]